ncbi:MAG: helix-turn-helix domain-containing protein [Gemmataceae bacterium]
MTFAERLRELREQAGLTQARLAETSGLPLGSIRNYEQGQREPYWQVVFKLADALGVSVEAFKDCIDAGQSKARTSTAKRRSKRK